MMGSRATLVLLVLVAAASAAAATFALHLHGAGATHAPPARAIFVVDGRTVESCGHTDRVCMSQAFGNLAAHKGARAALALLQQRMASDPSFEQMCHPVAHFVGFGSLDHNHGDIGRTLADGSSICSSGFYHGVLQRAFDGVSTARLDARVRQVCGGATLAAVPSMRFECAHGVGHGLMIQQNFQLPSALAHCDALDPNLAGACYSGAFMENNAPSLPGAPPSRWKRANDIEYPCANLATRYRKECYERVVTHARDLRIGWPKIMHVCAGFAQPWAGDCADSLGRHIQIYTVGNAAKVHATCAVDATLQSACLSGAANSMVTFNAHLENVRAMCAVADRALAIACMNGVGLGLYINGKPPAVNEASCRAWGSFPAAVAQCVAAVHSGVAGNQQAPGIAPQA